jgi:hypothetical protein
MIVNSKGRSHGITEVLLERTESNHETLQSITVPVTIIIDTVADDYCLLASDAVLFGR